ncbi:MAG: nicotinate-nucleotide--dimethylbenzimidazole phosphoribosyltransferase, partial [Gammaproteobacteria bacterium]|nr:nicotinate-nucleotide--dimethylbenzimidazole phosphoribosyltransferase [Gammaproteobacteria bacterium]
IDPVELAGPGTGLGSEGISHKVEVIKKSLKLHQQSLADPLEVLRCVGGFELAALTGAYIRAAQLGIPVVVDGFICSAAALAAIRIEASVANWLILSHASAEPGHAAIVNALGDRPLIDLGMRLGEGSGAATIIPLLRMACQLHNGMATFAEAGVADGS